MPETSRSIRAWGRETFGDPETLAPLVERARLELDELAAAVAAGEPDAAVKLEAADVAILLHRIVGILGGELSDAVDAKMAINRARRWNVSGDGTGSHIPGD
ncbi:dATP/dGTP pyrophosphohydrolase domain-containing protein [Parvularcula lutaonensis]|uniref:dATP/dGTP pyrophosphohydrolase domain-containing protein n=1 Tax=Parvularcula lutaonensis TaxID=491923 RepID=A0ABV7MFP3_9PROT|nr:dATP/dGTP pyrophosphohydrolase domain-containing protein [Parvularcula lutaonensis]GGY54719.1 hypothetical protein GCM10007148_25540 [Parvularcula lutaonensis]